MNDALLIKPTLIWTRRVLYFSSALVISVGLSLYLLSESTETFFSWTIQVPLTAAFLGSGYLSSFILEFLAAREPVWARSRIAMPAVLVFTILTLIATLIHLDKFHFNAPQILTAAGTWLFHLAIGIGGLLTFKNTATARQFLRIFGIALIILTVMGLIPQLNTIFGLVPLFGHDIWLHGLEGIIALFLVFAVKIEPASPIIKMTI